MEQGGTAMATAQVFGSSGAAMSGGFTLVWRSSNPAAVLVAPRTGALRAAGPGTAWIVAMAGDARDSVRVTVTAPATAAAPPPNQPGGRRGQQPVAPTVASVEIQESNLDLQVGSPPRPLSVVVMGSNDRRIQWPVTWRSSDPQVARVDARGRVTAVGTGSALIIAMAEGHVDQVGVTVAAATPVPSASQPAPTALPSADEVRAAVAGYLAALGSNDRDTVTRLWGNAPEGDRGDLLDDMGQRGFRVTPGAISSPVADGTGATVTFPVAAVWRSNFGQNRSGSYDFVARLERVGNGWRLASVVLQ
jgi:hypothetical protein